MMENKKEKLLNNTYKKFLDLMLGDLPIDLINEVVVDDITGYGTTKDEKILDINRLRQLVIDQREQGAGIEIYFDTKPVHRRISSGKDTALFVDEMKVTMQINTDKKVLNLRLSTVLEFIQNRWKVVHIHGSTGVDTEGDTWHLKEWQRKNEELQKLVDEKTTDLLQKNRNLEIEAALERVRVRAMSMKQSDELQELVSVVFNELMALDISLTRCIIWIFNPADLSSRIWMENPEDKLKAQSFHIPFHEHKTYEAFIKAWKDNLDIWEYDLNGETKTSWDKILFTKTEMKDLPDVVQKAMRKPDRVVVTATFNNFGAIQAAGLEPLSKEQCNILERFGKVFDLSYTRFNDLKQAEEQAREALIELALERVRARTIAMQHSSELSETAALLFQQVKSFGVKVWNCAFNIWEKDEKICTTWNAGNDDKLLPPIVIPLTEDPTFKLFYESRQKGESFYAEELRGEAIEKHYRYMLTLPSIAEIFKDRKNAGFSLPKHQVNNIANFSHGNVMFITYEQVPEAHDIFKRFAKVFEQTYTRFLDLQNAESQAREAQIETGLEKVRADMMAMHKSDELRQVVGSVFKQLQNLGFDAPTCSVIIYDEDFSAEHWFSGMGQDIYPKSYKIPYVDNPYFTDLLNAWKKGISFREFSMEGKLKIEYGKWLLEHSEFIKLPEEFRKDMLTPDRLVLSDAFMRYGMIEILGPEPLPAEKASILQRFSKVFEQTYTRFLDLQNAEEQNKIIQAENKRKSQELEEARQLQLAMLPKELPKLPNLDIAVYMQTATEVGGDYYDFRVGLDGTLNVVLGDATGHGLKAGTLVTIMKGLFTAEAESNDILSFFNKSSKAIKELKLGRLMMAFVFLKIKERQLSLSNAGVPPVYIFRSKKEEVEEIDNKGMPLGAMKNFPYKETKIELNKGDVILLLSDGLPELFNDKKEMFGYDRVKETFLEVADRSSEKIIEHLKNTASDWVNDKDPDDDITFVVLKMK